MGKIIAKEFNFGKEFLLGTIAPDVNKNSKTPKELTHFMVKREDGEHDMFPKRFLEKYGPTLTEFELGYYLHLISDNLWLNTVYKNNILKVSVEKRPEQLEMFYSDFVTLNKILIDKYQLAPLCNVKSFKTKVDEVIDSDLINIENDLNNDFIYKQENDKELKLLRISDIINYIEVSVQEFKDFLEK